MGIPHRHRLVGAVLVTVACLSTLIAATASALAQPSSWQREWPNTDFTRTTIDFDEVMSGGPPKDGIPSIDDPVFEPAAEVAGSLAPTEPVMSLVIEGEARAYPLRVLMWHEIVNDRIGDTPIAVTYCPLCNSGIVFDRRIAGPDGGALTLEFGTTGKLRHSDLVMFDRQTESWWQQYSGRAIVGALTGTELDRIQSRLESVERFVERHPDGAMLVPSNPRARPYGNNPYAGYDTTPRPFLYRGDYDGPGAPLMRVVAVHGAVDGQAWSLPLLRERGRIETDDGLILTWAPGQNSALDAGAIREGRDVGNVVVQRRSDAGELRDVLHDIPFAFAFRAFHPDGPIHHLESDEGG
ncbi:MAG: DUF3179 domain-containing protein [Azospirillaceae bacterium]